jgi:hypothetical protein
MADIDLLPPTDEELLPPAEEEAPAPPAEDCDHKFVDSEACLKCGWVPPADYAAKLDAIAAAAEAPAALIGELLPPDDAPPPTPEQALEQRATTLAERAAAFEVVDALTAQQADELITSLKDRKREIEAFFEEDVDNAYKAWKGLTTKRAGFIKPVEEAIAILSPKYTRWVKAEEERAEEERREAERAAQKAEQDRLDAERRRLEEEAAALRERAAETNDPRQADRIAQEAATVAAEAQQVAQEALTVQAPVLPAKPVYRGGAGGGRSSVKDAWKWALDDVTHGSMAAAKLVLIKAVAEGKVNPEALEIRDVYITSRVRSDKDQVNIPGIRVWNEGAHAAKRK